MTGTNKIPEFGMGSKIIMGNKIDEKSWAAVVVLNPQVQIMKIPELSNSHCVVVEVMPKGAKSFYIVNVYCQFKDGIERYLTMIERAITKLDGKDILITMDANAKSPIWGGQKADEKGIALMEMIAAQKLNIINDISEGPTFIRGGAKSHIDVTIATNNLKEKVSKWSINWLWTSSPHV